MVRVHPDPPRRAAGSGAARQTGGVAQLGEHLLCKQGVIGSIPFTSTNSAGKSEAKAPVVSWLLPWAEGIGCSLTNGKK